MKAKTKVFLKNLKQEKDIKPNARMNNMFVGYAMESYAQQIHSEEQAKTRGTAVEFAVDMISPFTTDYKEILTKLYNDRFDEWFTNKAQHCSECGKPMEKKEIIIKGDIDTCDDCLCPE